MIRVLVLGGTGEGRRLAEQLTDRPDTEPVTSLAGRVVDPKLPPGSVRIGGFGGVDGLADWLVANRIGAVVDATHPFASRITDNALAATAAVGVPLVLLRRPGWREQPGDDWHRVPSLAAAADLLPSLAERVLLTTGRQGLVAFAHVGDCWFLVRSVEPPEPPMPVRMRVLLDRGPFTVDGERALLTGERIGAVVTKDSGGGATAAKLVAARELGLPVVMVDRPPGPTGGVTVATVEAALAWLDDAPVPPD
jgi:precorrin-6A/cobalt-precorrin-6A reductase